MIEIAIVLQRAILNKIAVGWQTGFRFSLIPALFGTSTTDGTSGSWFGQNQVGEKRDGVKPATDSRSRPSGKFTLN
jgi:hypothetical protein